MSRAFAYFLALTSLILSGLENLATPIHKEAGVHVLLGKACPDGIDARQLKIRYLLDGRLFLNDFPYDEFVLRAHLREALETRAEKLVWVAGDSHAEYGSVLALISKLQLDTPELHIGVATRSQVGPVDPSEISRIYGPAVLFGPPPCVMVRPSQIS